MEKIFWILLISVFDFWTGLESATVRCPNGFLGHEHSCYKFAQMPSTWMEAKVWCEAMDAHLVEIDSPIEEQFLMQHVYFTNPDLQEIGLWVGGSDLMNENEWLWMHSKKRLGYHNWNLDRAEATAKGHGHCLAMQLQPTYAWREAQCDESANFICELEME